MDWNPESKQLWAAVQERDGLGDDLVPDFFTSIREGAYYGWPYAYIGPNEEPRNKGQRPDLVAKTVVPDVLLEPSHVAAMDARFYRGKQFPAKYRNGAFVALRGSSNRAKRTGYSIVFIPFKGGRPSGPQEDFLTGFMLDPDNKEVWGRPVGLLERKDGSLLMSEDGGNKVYWVRYGK
jgi:glucose/arabinose dehydrogenase